MTSGDATAPLPGPPDGVLLRTARPSEVDEVAELLLEGRAHISGSRSLAVFRALVRDSLGSRPTTTIVVAEREADHALLAVLVAVNGDLPGYYRSLTWRHPRAASAIVAHRLRKLPYRFLRRRKLRQETASEEVEHPQAAPLFADEPRMQQPPRAADDPGPKPTETGPEISFCLYVLVDAQARGTGLGKAIVAAALQHLRALGATRYDCSFVGQDVAAARMYLSMPFDIQRFPAGYFASIDLRPIPPVRLPS